MSPPIVFDITHLVSRRKAWPRTGIDRVNFGFAEALASLDTTSFFGIRFGAIHTQTVSHDMLIRLLQKLEKEGAQPRSSSDKRNILEALLPQGSPLAGSAIGRTPTSKTIEPMWISHATTELRWLLSNRRNQHPPSEGTYLNLAPYGSPAHLYQKWLSQRPNIKAVFFVHDLLPIDHPEFFPSSWQRSFQQMTSVVMRRADGIVVASNDMRTRVEAELKKHGRSNVRIHVDHLPPSPIFAGQTENDHHLQALPYFVMCATIEPRKNHILLLKIWRQLAERLGEHCPYLVLVGKRGWKNKQTISLLETVATLTSRVIEVGAISDATQKWLVSNACGTLFPTFAEGYGLPVVESLSIGLPTVVSDIPVMREISQGKAIFHTTSDTSSWLETIVCLSSRSSPAWNAAASLARQFRSPTQSEYYASVLHFLRSI